MATRVLKAMQEKGTHSVGNLNSIKIRTITNGALVEGADVDNFTLVELDFNADGERICKQLSDVKNKSYLIAAVERRYLGEEMADFYNAEGDRARIVILDEGVRFESSAFSLSGVTEIKNGQKAHFDPVTKKFIIHDGSHADFAGADKKFVVVNNEEDLAYTFGVPMVRFEVQ